MFLLFLLAITIQAGYSFYFFCRIFRSRDAAAQEPLNYRPVTVIICARNEAVNLGKNLPVVLSQTYPVKYEVIVVNDASTDNTTQVLQDLEQLYDNLWDVVIAPGTVRDLKGKKFALSKGLQHATGEWLVLTDADCVPASEYWLELMVAPLASGKQIVAGYGGYRANRGLLNAFIRWETMHTFLQYSTYALAGVPYMAVGRNMACMKSVLEQAQQSKVWNALPSGDDDLLVSTAGNGENVAIVNDKRAFTYTDAKETWTEWVKQKQRHLSTGKYYKRAIKILLGGYAVTHALLWLTFFVLIFTSAWKLVLIIMAVRCLLYWSTWLVASQKPGERRLFYYFPFFDIGWMVYNFAFLPYITFKDKGLWS